MAKDDYFVLVYKILAYLYTVLKEGRCGGGACQGKGMGL